MKKLIFIPLLILFSCSKSKSKHEVDKFNQEHEAFLDKIKVLSNDILNENFNFKGIEIIYVQSGQAYYQWLGHVFLRFVGSGQSPSEDYGVSFIANFNEFNLDNYKAYYGGYTVLPIIDKWKNYINDYLIKEQRYMDRHIIPTNKEQRHKIKMTLRDWIVNPSLPGTYSFRRNSCTALLLKLLQAGLKQINGEKVVFPIEVITYLKSLNLISYSYKRINTNDKIFNMRLDISKYNL